VLVAGLLVEFQQDGGKEEDAVLVHEDDQLEVVEALGELVHEQLHADDCLDQVQVLFLAFLQVLVDSFMDGVAQLLHSHDAEHDEEGGHDEDAHLVLETQCGQELEVIVLHVVQILTFHALLQGRKVLFYQHR